MIFRKAALSLFEKALSWNESEIHEKEKLLHDIIFPTRKDSSDVDNEGHNLWLIDESLSFTQYLSSDKKRFTESSDRPDIAAFIIQFLTEKVTRLAAQSLFLNSKDRVELILSIHRTMRIQ